MKKLSAIGGLLKKIYRIYSTQLLAMLHERGFSDLRPSFLEVLIVICETDGLPIKDIGKYCELKKQTMTSHLNELESRGYIAKKINPQDKREQQVYLTYEGEKFKLALLECMEELEKSYSDIFGSLEIDRMELLLNNFHSKVTTNFHATSSI